MIGTYSAVISFATLIFYPTFSQALACPTTAGGIGKTPASVEPRLPSAVSRPKVATDAAACPSPRPSFDDPEFEVRIPIPSAASGAATSGLAAGAAAPPPASSLARVSRRYDIDPAFLEAVVRAESGANPRARSAAGAAGLMQLMPATAARFGLLRRSQLFDPATNLQAGAAYLKTLQKRYGVNLPLVLAAYNAGEGAVERHGRRLPPYAETTRYVSRVLALYRQALERRAAAGAGWTSFGEAVSR